MAEIMSRTDLFSPVDHRPALPSHLSRKRLSPSLVSFPFKSVRYSSLKSDFHGRRLVGLDRKSIRSCIAHTVSVQMGLQIGKSMKWWEKGLQINMKEIESAQDLADALLNAGNRLVVVDFFSPGCGGCRALHPKVGYLQCARIIVRQWSYLALFDPLRKKAGVVDLGQLMQLDGSYCCASCGKISGIIGFWKKQLAIAKEARRIDVLCHHIALCYKLLDGTSRFKELHEVVEQAKAKLEAEVGSVDGVSAKMARGIVSRLSVAGDIQDLCSLAIEKADEWLSSVSMSDSKNRDSCPAALKFIFEEITSTSVVIVLKDARSASEEVKGYKLWYCKSKELPYKRDPVAFPKEQRKILLSAYVNMLIRLPFVA